MERNEETARAMLISVIMIIFLQNEIHPPARKKSAILGGKIILGKSEIKKLAFTFIIPVSKCRPVFETQLETSRDYRDFKGGCKTFRWMSTKGVNLERGLN